MVLALGTRYDLEILLECGKSVKQKVRKFWGLRSRKYREKTGGGGGKTFCPPPPPILNRVNRATVNVSALSSTKIDKYEYLTGDEILPSNQAQIIKQSKFAYSPLKAG